MTYDKDIGMWHKKAFSNNVIKSCYKTKYFFDQEGRIRNNYQYDNSKKNVILMGDSNIEALMVRNENIIHNSLYNEIGGKYNVLNYGLSGTGPTQHLEILNKKIDLEEVFYLIHFVFLENDLNDGDPKNFDGTNRPKVHLEFKDLDNYQIIKPKNYDAKEKLRDFFGNFEIYVYLKKTYYYYNRLVSGFNRPNTGIKAIETDNNYKRNSDDEYQWQQLKGSIYQINKLSQKHKFQYGIVFLSDSEDKGDTEYTQKFKQFLLDQNIDNVNILRFLNDLKIAHELGFECDTHWNDNTHRSVAKHLTRELDL